MNTGLTEKMCSSYPACSGDPASAFHILNAGISGGLPHPLPWVPAIGANTAYQVLNLLKRAPSPRQLTFEVRSEKRTISIQF